MDLGRKAFGVLISYLTLASSIGTKLKTLILMKSIRCKSMLKWLITRRIRLLTNKKALRESWCKLTANVHNSKKMVTLWKNNNTKNFPKILSRTL